MNMSAWSRPPRIRVHVIASGSLLQEQARAGGRIDPLFAGLACDQTRKQVFNCALTPGINKLRCVGIISVEHRGREFALLKVRAGSP